MRRLLIIFGLLAVLIASSAVMISSAAAAVDVVPGCGSGSHSGTPDVCTEINNQQSGGTNNPIVKIIKAAIDVISYIVGAAAIIGILASALRMITSGGDSNAIASARSGLIYSLIGVAVVVLAQSIVIFVIDKL